MDRKGKALDNINNERFWSTLKRELVNLNPAEDGRALHTDEMEYLLNLSLKDDKV